MTVAIWYADASELADEARFDRAVDALPWPERRDKAMRFRFDKDRRLCVAGGLVTAHALRSWGARDLTMAYGEYGKPHLAHEPDIHFNLSHSGTLCACAVAFESVGVDVEVYQQMDERVARICFQEKECDWLGAQEDPDKAFARLWTRKESFLKLLGTGLSREMNAFSALPGDELALGVEFHEMEHAGYAFCACTHTPQMAVFERLDLTAL